MHQHACHAVNTINAIVQTAMTKGSLNFALLALFIHCQMDVYTSFSSPVVLPPNGKSRALGHCLATLCSNFHPEVCFEHKKLVWGHCCIWIAR